MTYYVAKSDVYRHTPYICINDHCTYCWYRNLSDIDPCALTETYYGSEGIDEWLSNLSINKLTLLYSFTQESHPEYFI